MQTKENSQCINVAGGDGLKVHSDGTRSCIYVSDDDEYSDPEIENEYEEEADEEEGGAIEMLLNDFPAGSDIVYYCALQEEKEIPRSTNDFEMKQTDVTPRIREKAVKWILELNAYFKLTNDAKYNAVTYLDIVLSNRWVQKKELQLYTAVCYWLAAKVDTRAQPSVERINEATGEKFTQEEFNATEGIILDVISYQLSYPTSKLFMRFYLSIGNCTEYSILVANLFTEIGLLKFEFMDFKPSVVAAASVIFALIVEERDADAKRVLSIFSSDSYLNIEKCIEIIQEYLVPLQPQFPFLENVELPISFQSFFKQNNFVN